MIWTRARLLQWMRLFHLAQDKLTAGGKREWWRRWWLEVQIVRIVRELQRNYERVYPWMVQARLNIYRAEGTLRRDMMRLVEQGKLVRVEPASQGRSGNGVSHARMGYRVAA